MVQIRKINLGTIIEENDFTLLRFNSGEVYLNNRQSIVFDAQPEDDISLVTIKTKNRKVSFFKLGTMYYPILRRSKQLQLPEDAEFCDILDADEEESYTSFIKYKVGKYVGVILASYEKLKNVIDNSSQYTDVTYSGDALRCYNGDKEKYDFIDKNGELINTCSEKYNKVKGTPVYFYKKNIKSMGCEEFSVPERILSVECLNENCGYPRTINVCSDEKNYYYVRDNGIFKLIFSGLKNDKILNIGCAKQSVYGRFFISEYDDSGKWIRENFVISTTECISYTNSLECESNIEFIASYDKRYFYLVDSRYIYCINLKDVSPHFDKVFEFKDKEKVNGFDLYSSSCEDKEYKEFELCIIASNDNVKKSLLCYDFEKGTFSKKAIACVWQMYSKKWMLGIASCNTYIIFDDDIKKVEFIIKAKRAYRKDFIWDICNPKRDCYVFEMLDGSLQVIPLCD